MESMRGGWGAGSWSFSCFGRSMHQWLAITSLLSQYIWYSMLWHGMATMVYGMVLYGMRPSIKTATALPLQLLPEKNLERNTNEENCFPSPVSFLDCWATLSLFSVETVTNILWGKNLLVEKNWVLLKCLQPPGSLWHLGTEMITTEIQISMTEIL